MQKDRQIRLVKVVGRSTGSLTRGILLELKEIEEKLNNLDYFLGRCREVEESDPGTVVGALCFLSQINGYQRNYDPGVYRMEFILSQEYLYWAEKALDMGADLSFVQGNHIKVSMEEPDGATCVQS